MKSRRKKIILIAIILMATSGVLSIEAQTSSNHLTIQLPTIHVMTYNIRYENAGDTGAISWTNRKEFIRSTILFHKADIIGMQEVLHQQLMFFDSTLKDFSHVGVGRED